MHGIQPAQDFRDPGGQEPFRARGGTAADLAAARELAEDLKVTLFRRDRKDFRLTLAGVALLREAVKLQEVARRRAAVRAQGKTGKLSVSVILAALLGPLPRSCAIFTGSIPRFRFISSTTSPSPPPSCSRSPRFRRMWSWGRLHHGYFEHLLTTLLLREGSRTLDIGPFPKGGSAATPMHIGVLAQGRREVAGSVPRVSAQG